MTKTVITRPRVLLEKYLMEGIRNVHTGTSEFDGRLIIDQMNEIQGSVVEESMNPSNVRVAGKMQRHSKKGTIELLLIQHKPASISANNFYWLEKEDDGVIGRYSGLWCELDEVVDIYSIHSFTDPLPKLKERMLSKDYPKYVDDIEIDLSLDPKFHS